MKMCFKLCFVASLMILSECLADDFYLNELKIEYQYDAWAGTTQTNYINLIHNWNFDIFNYGATNNYAQPTLSDDPNFYWGIYILQPTNLLCNVDLRFIEASSILNAHEMLMKHFSGCTATQPFPTGASIGINIGDHCYTGYPIGSTNSISFVRNNMFICISSGDPPESVYEIANKIDQQLLTISLTPE